MLTQRIVTAGIFGVGVVAAIMLLPSLWAGLLLGALWLIGVREWAGFAHLQPGPAFVYVAINAVAMLVIGWSVDSRAVAETMLAVAAAWWLLAFIALALYPRSISNLQTMLAGAATMLPPWAMLAWLHSAVDDGPLLILVLLAIVWSADTGAFFVGRAVGRHKLAPRVSPGKTWEGVAGGLALAGLVGALVGGLTAYGSGRLALVAVATAAISVIGDLNVSLFKRNAGLKDSGTLLPGHGGVLDRVDSVTAAVAMFVPALLLVGIIT